MKNTLHPPPGAGGPPSARDGTVGRGALLPHPRALMLASRSTLKDFFRLS